MMRLSRQLDEALGGDIYVPSEDEIMDALNALHGRGKKSVAGIEIVQFLARERGKKHMRWSEWTKAGQPIANLMRQRKIREVSRNKYAVVKRATKGVGVEFYKDAPDSVEVSYNGKIIGWMEKIIENEHMYQASRVQKRVANWEWQPDQDILRGAKNIDLGNNLAKAKKKVKAEIEKHMS